MNFYVFLTQKCYRLIMLKLRQKVLIEIHLLGFHGLIFKININLNHRWRSSGSSSSGSYRTGWGSKGSYRERHGQEISDWAEDTASSCWACSGQTWCFECKCKKSLSIFLCWSFEHLIGGVVNALVQVENCHKRSNTCIIKISCVVQS